MIILLYINVQGIYYHLKSQHYWLVKTEVKKKSKSNINQYNKVFSSLVDMTCGEIIRKEVKGGAGVCELVGAELITVRVTP